MILGKDETQDNAVPRLALGIIDAAHAIGISQRSLYQMTKDGQVPHIRLPGPRGRVLYPVDTLREWLQRLAATPGA
jgi:predicted DNA-binding transcriptional regulator AlpA